MQQAPARLPTALCRREAAARRRRGLLALLALFVLGGWLPNTASEEQLEESFSEELLYQELEDGSLLAHFHFQSVAPLSKHYALFPRAIKQLAATQPVEEFELSFTHGHWRPKWGQPVVPTKPVGAELWARFRAQTQPQQELDSGLASRRWAPQWRSLTHALGGLFCASLNFLDHSLSSAGSLAMSGMGGAGAGAVEYGALPREAVCTENLTPWLKLLPCRDAGGLAALLDRAAVYGADYHLMRTHLAAAASPGKLVLTQSLTLVLRQAGAAAVDSAAAGPCKLLGAPWGARHTPPSACPVATASTLHWAPTGSAGRPSASWDLRGGACRWAAAAAPAGPPAPRWPAFRAHRYLAGKGDERGTIVTEVRFEAGAEAGRGGLLLCVSQLVPWYVRLYLHSLALTVDGQPASWEAAAAARRLLPGRDRQRPAAVELCLANVTSAAVMHLTMSFDKAFLTVTEHPPDTHRGFDIPAAMVFLAKEPPAVAGRTAATAAGEPLPVSATPLRDALLAAGNRSEELFSPVVYTEGLLLPLALPDFSMPYNVTCFTCTLLSVYLGSLLATMLRRPRAAAARAAAPRGARARAARIAAVVLVFGAAMLVLDKEVQRQAGSLLGVDLEAMLEGLL
eukprot:jgi/Tetstr1/436694/TSEL_002722.t1